MLFIFLNKSFFNISSTKFLLFFHNFISDFVSYKFDCYCSCFMDYFLEDVFSASTPVLVAVSNNCFQHLSDKFLVNGKHLGYWFYRITFHFHLLISNVKFILSSISNGLLFDHQSQCYKFSKPLSCLVQHLIDKHKTCWV